MQLASLHHFIYRSASYWDDAADDDVFFTHRKSRMATIGHDCWIGHGAVIRPEIRIGTGAVIGAGAIVTRDVPDYWIVTGVPAKPMRPRFTESIIARLLALAWWEWPHGDLRAALTDFRSLPAEDFLARYDG
jgi:phosphonate metabolism protein (transferase hexapeptide repeat family)